MKHFESIKDDLIRALLWLLMLMSLVASMRHVAWLFSTIELMNYASGWIAAVGFDFGIFLLTLIAHKYKEGTPQRRFIRAGIYANAVLSAIANVMYGVEHQVELSRVNGLLWLLIPYVFALALPMMVVFFAEVLSREEENESRAFERERRQINRQNAQRSAGQVAESPPDILPENGQVPPESRQISRAEKIEIVLKAVANGAERNRQIVAATRFGRSSVTEYLAKLAEDGRIIREGSRYFLAENGQTPGQNLAESGEIPGNSKSEATDAS